MPDCLIRLVRTANELSNHEVTILLEAQREILKVGGVLGLTSDLWFVIAGDSFSPYGILACRTADDGAIWIQIAFVRTTMRRCGLLREMVNHLMAKCPGKEIGLGTKVTNQPMLAAAEALGFRQKVAYLYREAAQ